MYTLAELAKKIQTVLGATADQLTKTTGFIKRQRNLTGAKFVRALTLGFLQKPAATLEELTQSGVLNEVEISPQGLDKRFNCLNHGCRQPSRRKHRNTWKTLIDTKPVWA